MSQEKINISTFVPGDEKDHLNSVHVDGGDSIVVSSKEKASSDSGSVIDIVDKDEKYLSSLSHASMKYGLDPSGLDSRAKKRYDSKEKISQERLIRKAKKLTNKAA